MRNLRIDQEKKNYNKKENLLSNVFHEKEKMNNYKEEDLIYNKISNYNNSKLNLKYYI